MSRMHSKDVWKQLRSLVNRNILPKDFWEDLSHLVPPVYPRTDMYCREERELIVEMELPGLSDQGGRYSGTEAIQVMVEGNVLRIKTAVPEPSLAVEKEMLMSERFRGLMERSLPLPHGYVVKAAQSAYRQGLLTIALQLEEEPKQQLQISVDQPCEEPGSKRDNEEVITDDEGFKEM